MGDFNFRGPGGARRAPGVPVQHSGPGQCLGPGDVRRHSRGDVRRPAGMEFRRDCPVRAGRLGWCIHPVALGRRPDAHVRRRLRRHVELPQRPQRGHQRGPLAGRVTRLDRGRREPGGLPAHGGEPRDRSLARPGPHHLPCSRSGGVGDAAAVHGPAGLRPQPLASAAPERPGRGRHRAGHRQHRQARTRAKDDDRPFERGPRVPQSGGGVIDQGSPVGVRGETVEERGVLRQAQAPCDQGGGVDIGEGHPRVLHVGVEARCFGSRLRGGDRRQFRRCVDLQRPVPRLGRPAPGGQRSHDGLLDRVVIVFGIGRGGQSPARPCHPGRFPQPGRRVRQVVEGEGGDHGVEGARREGQRQCVAGHGRGAGAGVVGEHAPSQRRRPPHRPAPAASNARVAAPVPAPRSSADRAVEGDGKGGDDDLREPVVDPGRAVLPGRARRRVRGGGAAAHRRRAPSRAASHHQSSSDSSL